MSKTKKEITPVAPIEFDYSKEQIVFSDLAEVIINEENVAICFATKNRDGKKALVSHKVYLTFPHFFRLVDVSVGLKNKVLNDMNERAKGFMVSSKEKNKKL